MFRRIKDSREIDSPMDLESEILFTGSYKECLEYSLVLASQSIPSVYVQGEDGHWNLSVDSTQSAMASIQIQEYQHENSAIIPTLALPPLLLSAQPLWVLLIPFAITFVQFRDLIPGFSRHGMNDAQQTLHGEWWRTVTALTLHGDGPHLASNLISAYFVLSLLAGRIPLTRIVPQLFLASALANFCVALTVQNDFRSLGFSTFVFASLGTLATIEWRLLPKEKTVGLFKRAEPVISAGFLAVMMGLGEDSDILAHGYGFLVGLFTGLIPSLRTLQSQENRMGILDISALVSVYLGVALAWKLALSQ